MNRIIVEQAWEESGFCRMYYNVKAIEIVKDDEVQRKEYTTMMICSQEETKGVFEWYTVCNDRCYYEPEGLIKAKFQIEDTEGKVLRNADVR